MKQASHTPKPRSRAYGSLRGRSKIFVAMSGGVDSSVAAALLKEAASTREFEKLTGRPTPKGFRGFDVRGVHIKMWSDPDIPCNFKEDRYDAMKVAAKLNIPFETWDLTKEYREQVVDYMIREYAQGRTPNPDVMCNRHIKFGVFLKKALEKGADAVATGHYVKLKISAKGGSASGGKSEKLKVNQLLQAKDKNKDQSYFLWTLTQKQLKHCFFPVGGYTKPEIRVLAKKFELPTAEKEESQGICFIGEINIKEFLKKYIPEERGKVLTTSGRVIGEHDGLSFYTIGERHGLGIGGGIPYYVAAKDFKTNALLVAEGPYDEKLFSKELTVTDISWISGKEPKLPLKCMARIRYRQPLQKCVVTTHDTRNSIHGIVNRDTCYVVRFVEPQRAVTSGQSVVFYKKEEMLGGGIIV